MQVARVDNTGDWSSRGQVPSPTVVIQFRQRRISGLQLFRGDTSPSAELRSHRHLCNDRCRLSRQRLKPWRFSSLQFVDKVTKTPLRIHSCSSSRRSPTSLLSRRDRFSWCTRSHRRRSSRRHSRSQLIDRTVNVQCSRRDRGRDPKDPEETEDLEDCLDSPGAVL